MHGLYRALSAEREVKIVDIVDQLQNLYRSSAQKVRTSSQSYDQAVGYYSRYLSFVTRSSVPVRGASLLDVGCGSGWSACLFAHAGFRTIGIDLSADAFEPPPTDNLTLQELSVLDLPFPDASFSVVAAYQTIEHVPDPERALLQMIRVCDPGGTICIAGPNLVSPYLALKAVALSLQNRPARRIFFRLGGMPRHPYGNTLPESLASVMKTNARLLRKGLSATATFTMRTPDLRPPFHSDNDACYLCCPMDLLRFFPKHRCQIVRNGAYGRWNGTALVAGGTWIAARKLGT
jgi:SAM-dependent methyltransferase